jgi:hypothetical protein
MTVWRMRIECCLSKATNTHSQYVTLIAFPLQQWLHERALMLCYTYIASFVIIEIVSPLWGMIWGGERIDHIFSSMIDCNGEWKGTHFKIPLKIYGWWSIASLLLRDVHANQCFSENLSVKQKNAAHAPELLMPFAHFLTLFSVSSVSIVITVLLDDWWINAFFTVGVPLASYLVGTEYALLCEKAAREWYWPCVYVWCWGQKFVQPFLHSLIPILSLVNSTA